MQCYQCGKGMKVHSIGCHLTDVHDIYQQTVVAKDLLEVRPPATYKASMELNGSDLPCPFSVCEGWLLDGWMMQRHFRDAHPMDLVLVPKEGKFNRCQQSEMQVNPLFPRHKFSKECQVEVEQKTQREAAVTSALVLWKQFSVNREALKWVKVFKYFGRLLAKDDDNIQAIRAQLWKAHATLA